MGLFDWLFGKKKDPYGPGFQRDYPSKSKPKGGHVPLPTGWDSHRDSGLRGRYLSFRLRRSKEHIGPVKDLTLSGSRNPMTGEASSVGAIGNIGGSARHPDIGFDSATIRSLGLPEIEHLDQLAQVLQIDRNQLVWLAARPAFSENTDAHYTLKAIPKKAGGRRLLMVPLPLLKRAQQRLLAELVRKLPVHEAAHGFRVQRNTLTGASIHVGKDVVIGLDIADFFPSFTFRRVSGYFRSRGYGRGISVALANLTTNRLLDTITKDGKRWKYPKRNAFPELFEHPPHPILPQGAPTSPGIANAICWRMDKRLAALALKFGGYYTRYADDLTFSGFGDMARGAERLIKLVRKIVETEGLALNEKKTRVMRQGRQQRVTGVVVNDQTNVSRRDFDRLKAILHNCIKHGPHGQNRENVPDFEQHLRGRIAHVSHIGPERGRKLMRMFEQIRW